MKFNHNPYEISGQSLARTQCEISQRYVLLPLFPRPQLGLVIFLKLEIIVYILFFSPLIVQYIEVSDSNSDQGNMASRIQRLSDEVVNRIAAGEVIHRFVLSVFISSLKVIEMAGLLMP